MPGKNQCRLQGGLGRHAFTLIEIIVAMTIIAVIAAVAIPTLKGLNEDEQRRAILVSIAEMVQTVRDRAMQERHPYEIVLEQGGLHAIPGNRSFYKREEFLEYLEKLRTPPVISDIARASMETTNVARNVPAPGAGAAPLPNQSTEGAGLGQGPQAPEMPDYTNTDDPRPIIDWMHVIRRRGIVYVGFDALTDPVVSAAVGASMFSDITAGLGHIYKHSVDFGLPGLDGGQPKALHARRARRLPKICVHADEFNEIIGEEFIPMLNKGGGAGLCVTAYTQTSSDIEARLGNLARAEQAMGNFNTLIMLRVKNQKTAEVLTSQLREVDVSTLVEVSGASDSSDIGDGVDFTSRNEDRISVLQVPTLQPADIMSLPKGQAYVLTEGATLRKIRIPLPARDDDAELPPTLEAMAKAMEKRYITGEQWWSQRVDSVVVSQPQASPQPTPVARPAQTEEHAAQ